MTADPARIQLLRQAAEGRSICPRCTKVFLELLDIAQQEPPAAPRKPVGGEHLGVLRHN